jgi:hypothetical protein
VADADGRDERDFDFFVVVLLFMTHFLLEESLADVT